MVHPPWGVESRWATGSPQVPCLCAPVTAAVGTALAQRYPRYALLLRAPREIGPGLPPARYTACMATYRVRTIPLARAALLHAHPLGPPRQAGRCRRPWPLGAPHHGRVRAPVGVPAPACVPKAHLSSRATSSATAWRYRARDAETRAAWSRQGGPLTPFKGTWSTPVTRFSLRGRPACSETSGSLDVAPPRCVTGTVPPAQPAPHARVLWHATHPRPGTPGGIRTLRKADPPPYRSPSLLLRG